MVGRHFFQNTYFYLYILYTFDFPRKNWFPNKFEFSNQLLDAIPRAMLSMTEKAMDFTKLCFFFL